MAEFFHVINQRSSIRSYLASAPSAEQIDLIVEAGLRAPTARNRQELHFSVLDTRHPLAADIQNALDPSAKTPFYYDAPVIIFISGADDFKWSRLDAGIAVENMHLAARALGLGSVILGCIDDVMNGDRGSFFRQALGIPDGCSFEIALAVGYPNTEKLPHEFDKRAKVTFVD